MKVKYNTTTQKENKKNAHRHTYERTNSEGGQWERK